MAVWLPRDKAQASQLVGDQGDTGGLEGLEEGRVNDG